MKILIDNGHGAKTRGKRSPDGRLLEYLENRIIARGLDASLLVPEETDISLPERCCRVNEWCRQLGGVLAILFSRKGFASSKRKSFKSVSPQSNSLSSMSCVSRTSCIRLQANGDILHRCFEILQKLFAIGRTSLLAETLNSLHLLHKTLGIATGENRCFFNWSSHRFSIYLSLQI